MFPTINHHDFNPQQHWAIRLHYRNKQMQCNGQYGYYNTTVGFLKDKFDNNDEILEMTLQREVGSQGYEHWQIAMTTFSTSKITKDEIATWFQVRSNDRSIYILKCGDPVAYRLYCCKERSRVEGPYKWRKDRRSNAPIDSSAGCLDILSYLENP